MYQLAVLGKIFSHDYFRPYGMSGVLVQLQLVCKCVTYILLV